MKNYEYEDFEDKYHRTGIYKKRRSKILPFVHTKVHMDVLSKFDTNAFARIDNAIYQEIKNFPERDYDNSIAYEMLIRTQEYKQLDYDSSLTGDEKNKVLDRLGIDPKEVYNFLFKKANFFPNNQGNTKNIFDSYCALTIGDVPKGIHKLIDFYLKRDQICTLSGYEKDVFGITTDIHYEVCRDINFKDTTADLSNYYVPIKPIASKYMLHVEKMSKIDVNLPLIQLEEEFLSYIEQDIPNNVKTKVTFNSTRPLLRFKESPIVEIPINLNLSKKTIIELISILKDEFDAEHIKSSMSYLYQKNFKAKNWKQDAPFKITDESMAKAFFVYDLYNDIDMAFQTKKHQLKLLRDKEIHKIETDTAKKIEKEDTKLTTLIEKRKLVNLKNTHKIIQQDKQDTKKAKRKLEKERDLEIKKTKKQYKKTSTEYDTESVLAELVKRNNISPYMCKQYLKFMRHYINNLQYKELIIGIEVPV